MESIEINKYEPSDLKQSVKHMRLWLKQTAEYKKKSDTNAFKLAEELKAQIPKLYDLANAFDRLKLVANEIKNLAVGTSDDSIFTISNDDIKIAFEKCKPVLISWRSYSCFVFKFNIDEKEYALKIPKKESYEIKSCFQNEVEVYKRLRFL